MDPHKVGSLITRQGEGIVWWRGPWGGPVLPLFLQRAWPLTCSPVPTPSLLPQVSAFPGPSGKDHVPAVVVIQRRGCGLHPEGVAAAGPHTEDAVPGCDAGEL